MLLLTGPAGSGKTAYLLERFREALREKNPGVRLLVPTATMAQHLRNQIAREGLVFRPGLIQTLSRFADAWLEDLPQVSEPLLYLIVEAAVRRVTRPEFARVAELPGFCAALARALGEFSSAGCDSERLSRHLPDTPLGAAFLSVYREVDRELDKRGLAMRARRLERVAERIDKDGMPGVGAVWLDGFHALPDPELAVIRAMSRHAGVTVTLPSGKVTSSTRQRLLELGFVEQACSHRRMSPAIQLCEAPTVEREADEIARRILEQAGAGRPFREVGIIVRNPQAYQPVLRATLERFGIPARFYLDDHAAEHAVVRFLAGAVDALLGGWDHSETLEVLRLAPALAGSAAMDRFDFAVREQLPGNGLEGLKILAQNDEPILRVLGKLGELEEWRSLALNFSQWAARAKKLRELFSPLRPGEPATHEMAAIWRGQSTVLELFDAALDQAGELDPLKRVPLGEFWGAPKAVLRLTPLRIPDQRRNVVHVIAAYEARQWDLPVVFVCGLVEKQFPRWHPPDPFFPEAARSHLNREGIRVRTAADFEKEERFLFDSAVSRATSLLVLSYPKFDSRGEQNLRSLYLDDMALDTMPSQPVKPQPVPRPPDGRPPVAIRSAELLKLLAEKHGVISPTALESYLQCPFQFFGNRTLRLQEPPARPEDRLDIRIQGNIIHSVLAELYRCRQPLEPLFDRIFRETCEALHIPAGYRMEAAHGRMLEDLHAFLADDRWPAGFRTRAEEKFEFALADSLTIRGRIDRLDVTEDGRAFVIDYKYSRPQGTRARADSDRLLQAPLYLLAVERVFRLKPAGMFYCGLRGGIQYEGWSAPGSGIEGRPFTQEWLESAVIRTQEAVAKIREGDIAPNPAELDPCRYCACRDVCRVQAGATAQRAEAG